MHVAGRTIYGVIGSKPPHMLKEEERKKAPRIEELYIDIGCKSRDEARQLGVRAGTIAYYIQEAQRQNCFR